MTFKVGDRVRVINGNFSFLKAGDIGDVLVKQSSGDMRLWIEARGGAVHCWVRECDVELVPPPFTDTDRLLFLLGGIRVRTPLVELLRELDEMALDEYRPLIDLAMEKNREC